MPSLNNSNISKPQSLKKDNAIIRRLTSSNSMEYNYGGELFFSYRIIEDAKSRIAKSHSALKNCKGLKVTLSNTTFF